MQLQVFPLQTVLSVANALIDKADVLACQCLPQRHNCSQIALVGLQFT